MIKFFRHIRKSLISENKMGKYFKYAIGEILLVVIGILIALQINNWNESNKRRAQEIKIYKEIVNDLELTKEEIQKDMQNHITFLHSNKALLNHLIEKKPYADSLTNHMFNVTGDLQVYPKTSGFDALNSIGLNLLSNDSIRIEITNLYQLYLKRVVNQGWRETPKNDIGNLMEPHLRRNLIIDTQKKERMTYFNKDSIGIKSAKIRNYKALLYDIEFQGALNRTILSRTSKIHIHGLSLGRINHAMASIKEELNRIEK